MEEYLIHHGILGQKWGVRRYQNKDGSLTFAGQKRYGNVQRRKLKEVPDNKEKSKLDKAFEPTLKNGKDKEKISPAEKITKDAKKAMDDTQNAMESIHKLKNRNNKPDYSQMSTREIQERINRINLERQLYSLEKEDMSKGYEVAKEVLTTVGSVVAITASVLGIVSTVNKLKNG